MLLKVIFSHVKSVEQSSIPGLKDNHISCPNQTNFMVASLPCIVESCSSLQISSNWKVRGINTLFYQCFYFSFPPLCTCPWKKRWPMFLYLAWGVMQHSGVRKSALLVGNITFENCDDCVKPSVRVVAQIWSHKEKEER